MGLRDLDRTAVLLAGVLLIVSGLLVHPYRAQQASRYALTAAIVEQETVILDSYESVLGVDRSVRNGHIYSDKAPGQPLLAVPFFAVGKAFGVEDATTLRIEENLGLWWITLWSSVIPGAALIAMIYLRIKDAGMRRPAVAAFAVFFGTLLLPFSSLLFGHVLAASLLFASYLLILRDESVYTLTVSGLFAGLAVTVEYTALIGVLVLGIFGLLRHRWRVWSFVGGGAVAAVGLAVYNNIAFDSPFVLSYQYTAFSEVTDSSRPLLGMFTSATLDNAIRLLFDGRGLILATPLVVVAVVAAFWMLRRRFGPDAPVALLMFAVFLLLPLFWGNPWGGDSPGPRYLTPALPFLGVPVAWAFDRWPRVTFAASGLSVVTMVAATITDPIVSRFSRGGLGIWINQILDGEVAPTLLTILWGESGWFAHAALLAIPIVFLIRSRWDRHETVDV